MAAGGQDVVDVIAIKKEFVSIRNELNCLSKRLSSAISSLPTSAGAGAAKFTVLSWNIRDSSDQDSSDQGSSDQDSSVQESSVQECRDILVSQVVNRINPDMLLLQDSYDTKSINCINRQCRRYYKNCDDEANDVKVLYDPVVFEFGGSIPLSDIVREVSPGETPEDLEKFKDKMTAFQLKHRTTEWKIVFMSFNNWYDDDEHKKKWAERFCKIVSRTAVKEKALVVAGADFWNNDFDHRFARIPKYYVPPERKDSVTTHFVSAWPGIVTVHDHVSLLDLDNICPTLLSVDDYKNSLCDDPIAYRLSVSNVQVYK